jgi:(p)ppGpp synthase/HD superfamily hydrolase
MTLPPGITEIADPLERAHALAKAAHAGQLDKTGDDYYSGHVLDVLRRVKEYGGDLDSQVAALLHDVLEDSDVTDADLVAAGFSDPVVLITHLMTRHASEPDEAYYARLRAYEPARRLKLDADMASNSDPARLAKVEPERRAKLEAKYAKGKQLLSR